MDTIDARKSEEWFNNLSNVLAGRNVDYIVISHLEPDHAANIKALSDKYPDAKLVLSAKAKAMLPQFFAMDNLDDKCIIAAEGQELSLGTHNLKFIMAPMVHWPEVMLEYETTEKVLFSADAFGKFGALSASEDWTCEARRYYFNIVGKYGAPVQTLLKKAAGVENIIKTVTTHKALGNGSIILMHNGAKFTADALDTVLTNLEQQGYEIVPISQLILKDNFHMDSTGRQLND